MMIWLLVAIVGLTVVLVVWQTIQITAVRRAVDAVPRDGNVIASLQGIDHRVGSLEETTRLLADRLAALEQRAPYALSRIGVVAYDAFGNIAGNLSRSMAFLSEQGDGLVLSVLAAREETLFYAKEVRAGSGLEQLSPEEQLAVDRAMGRAR